MNFNRIALIISHESTCSISIRFSWQTPFSKIKQTCLKALQNVPGILEEKTPGVILVSVAENLQVIKVNFWVVHSEKTNQVISEFYEKLIPLLEAEKISLAPDQVFFS